ncbi:hypothetical protein [uncultured Thiothrix sp.]|uniref:hypothetical protein n=1 Tax=uncultured Thiothrix sp. TaxID=223185 RepID=UPI0026102F0B|nr:hypothetical protein [uncultured Thiothrix sp.]
MLSYIDIEAFATASYRTVAKTMSSDTHQPEETAASSLSTVTAAKKQKQVAKRMIANAQANKTKRVIAAA